MLRRLLVLLGMKQLSQKIFEEKPERLTGGPTTPLHSDHHAAKIREIMANSPSSSDQIRKTHEKIKRQNSATRARPHSDDAATMALAMTPVQHKQVHHTTPHHAPSSGSDVTDGGSSCDGGGCGD